jgi:hypothetical protein
MGDLQQELELLDRRKQEVLYEIYIIEKYELDK